MKDRKQIKRIILYAVLAALAIIFVVIKRESYSSFFEQVFRILRPVIIGAVIAYLSNPIFRMFEGSVFHKTRSFTARRTLSLICTYIVLILIVAILLMLIIPQLMASVFEFLENYEQLIADAMENINGFIEQLNASFRLHIPAVNPETLKQGLDWIVEKINMDALMDRFLSGNTILLLFAYIEDAFFVVTDVIFGLFISIYLLSGKEKIYAQIMRTRKALFNSRINERITRVCTIADKSFGGFLRGKLLDSTIVAILTYIVIFLLGVPYPLLISVIIGITDIVPVVGPWIGIIPSALIVLLTDPIKVIPLLLAILIVQQIDSNIIAPKILGENTGVSSLCVMVAITVMGAVWGLAGMVLGVPFFATIIELTNEFLNKRLEKKGLPTEIENDENEEEKKPMRRREMISLSDGCGPLTSQEKERLLSLSLVRKYDLYTSQNNATVAACVNEFRGATQQAEPQEPEAEPLEAETVADTPVEETTVVDE